MQIVGKIQLMLNPPLNHWWQVAFHLSPRGLRTSPIPYGQEIFELEFDFFDHRLLLETSRGQTRNIFLEPQSVADFYQAVMSTLEELGISVKIWTLPCEIPGAVRFELDRLHTSYDAEYVHRFWRVLVSAEEVLRKFRSSFLGKASPVHFFWGSFDLAATRFSGRRAPERPGADSITREAYSHEVISAGFWPGTGDTDAAFYAYAAPEPSGFSAAAVPPGAFYSAQYSEFLLPYETLRRSGSPRETLLAFLQSTYEAGASLGHWDRAQLERSITG
jgi:Family of unknown function (DUF5996)